MKKDEFVNNPYFGILIFKNDGDNINHIVDLREDFEVATLCGCKYIDHGKDATAQHFYTFNSVELCAKCEKRYAEIMR